MSIEAHKESVKRNKRETLAKMVNEAHGMLRLVLGDLLDEAQNFGYDQDKNEAFVKFKNHDTIYVKPMNFTDGVQYWFSIDGRNFTHRILGSALIDAEIPNTWWNRLTGRYKI